MRSNHRIRLSEIISYNFRFVRAQILSQLLSPNTEQILANFTAVTFRYELRELSATASLHRHPYVNTFSFPQFFTNKTGTYC